MLFLPRERKIHVSKLTCSVLMMVFLMIFQRFPTTFQRFPKIFQNCSEGQTNIPKHFPRISENSRRFPKISEDCRRLSRKNQRCFDDKPTNLLISTLQTNLISVKSLISSHVRISSRFCGCCCNSILYRLYKVTKESSGANKIMRNAIDFMSINLRWTSSSSQQSVFSTTSDGSQRSPNLGESRRSVYLLNIGPKSFGDRGQNLFQYKESNLGPVAGY